MNRTYLLNHLIKKHSLKSYLEIGVQHTANNFDKIALPLKSKFGVDPALNAPQISMCDSDFFFSKCKIKFDLIFIDGLHHADQAERDFNNSLRCLNDGGFIVLHDCLPENEVGTRVPRETKQWWGDVYKFIFKLNIYDGIDFVTYNFDNGCCVVWMDENKKGAQIRNDIDWNFYLNNKNLLRIANNIRH